MPSNQLIKALPDIATGAKSNRYPELEGQGQGSDGPEIRRPALQAAITRLEGA